MCLFCICTRIIDFFLLRCNASLGASSNWILFGKMTNFFQTFLILHNLPMIFLVRWECFCLQIIDIYYLKYFDYAKRVFIYLVAYRYNIWLEAIFYDLNLWREFLNFFWRYKDILAFLGYNFYFNRCPRKKLCHP